MYTPLRKVSMLKMDRRRTVSRPRWACITASLAVFLGACDARVPNLGDLPLGGGDGEMAEGSNSGAPLPRVDEPLSDPDPLPQLAAAEREAIERAAVRYVREETAITDVRVEVQAAAEDWARVRVLPLGGVTDPAVLFLRRTGGTWQGVAIGTAFTPEDLDQFGVPARVRAGG